MLQLSDHSALKTRQQTWLHRYLHDCWNFGLKRNVFKSFGATFWIWEQLYKKFRATFGQPYLWLYHFNLLTLNMLSADYSGIWRNGHSATYDVTNLHVRRFLWFASSRAWIDLSTGLSIFNIDCIPTELIEKNAISFWCKIGAKTGQTYRSKLFRPVEGVHRVKDRENKKAEKNERKGARKKSESPNFGLCACAKVKYCTFLHGNFIKIFLHCQKVHF